MSWLFGKKKVPKVPLPQPRPFDEGALRFPSRMSTEMTIGPEQLKEAAGVSHPLTFPEEDLPSMPEPMEHEPFSNKPIAPKLDLSLPQKLPRTPLFNSQKEPLFIQVEVYRSILGAGDGLKHDLLELSETNKLLESSEYNEDNRFSRLRKEIKGIHDRLLHMDKILFKS